jgi:hypothetical protein
VGNATSGRDWEIAFTFIPIIGKMILIIPDIRRGDEKGVWCPHCKAQNRFLSKKSVDKYVKPYEYRVRDIFADEVHVFDGGGFPAKYKLGEWEPWEEKSKAKDINNPFSCFVNL